ncbi:MAG: helix-turn-helix domain-containing protein [Clostridia bacterium]|nr:helix-turn-helix domain-containing protein [Clostridia bacterium]
MDQASIGKFIQELRKEKNLTQKELAEKLLVSDKTVSKWERGGGLPEVSLMLPLCGILGISVNELLSAQRLDDKNFKQKAEENVMDLIKQKAEERKKRNLCYAVIALTLISSMTLFMLVGYLEMKTWLKVLLSVIATVVLTLGIIVVCIMERETGSYECSKCGNRFTPTFKAYLFGPHFGFTRKLKCPKCGQKSYCKKKWSESQE